jgi:hypothetical protein
VHHSHQLKGLHEEKPMGFGSGGVWGMWYGRFMGYAMHFPANQLGGPKMLWGLRGYGFSEVWVKRGSTVK